MIISQACRMPVGMLVLKHFHQHAYKLIKQHACVHVCTFTSLQEYTFAVFKWAVHTVWSLPTFWTQLLKKQSTQHCLQSCRLHTVLHTLSLQECKFPGFKLVERACIHLELAKWGQASNTRKNKQMSIHTENKINHGSKSVFFCSIWIHVICVVERK